MISALCSIWRTYHRPRKPHGVAWNRKSLWHFLPFSASGNPPSKGALHPNWRPIAFASTRRPHALAVPPQGVASPYFLPHPPSYTFLCPMLVCVYFNTENCFTDSISSCWCFCLFFPLHTRTRTVNLLVQRVLLFLFPALTPPFRVWHSLSLFCW